MRGPCHLTSAGQPGSRSSLFCTGTSYLRDMARAPALLGQTLPSHEDLLCLLSMGTATRYDLPGHQTPRRRLSPLYEGL